MRKMKHRSTTPAKSLTTKASLIAAAVLMAGSTPVALSSVAVARDYDAEIRAREQEASKYSNEAMKLGDVASSLEAALKDLRAQADAIQQSINQNEQKLAKLKKEIADNEKRITDNRDTLGQLLADMYVDDQITPLEMLASSKNLGDYIDKQEYRNSIQSALSQKIDAINKLQRKLEDQKKQVETVLKEQQVQREALNAKQQEQAKLIAETRNDEENYRKLAQQRNAEISNLREQQRAANLAALQSAGKSSGGSNSGANTGAAGPGLAIGGGYPAQWANAAQDSIIDPWGMYNRECVSYVAFRISNSGRHMPYWGGRGDAKQWPSSARQDGIPTGSTPKAGAAAVLYGGPYGHIMYVEAVNGDGTINVSDYNLGGDGKYHRYNRSAAGLTYIYF